MTDEQKANKLVTYISNESRGYFDALKYLGRQKFIITGRLDNVVRDIRRRIVTFSLTEIDGTEHKCYIHHITARECLNFICSKNERERFVVICSETETDRGCYAYFTLPLSERAVALCKTICSKINAENADTIAASEKSERIESETEQLPFCLRSLAEGQLSAVNYGKTAESSEDGIPFSDWKKYYEITREHFTHTTQRRLDKLFRNPSKDDKELAKKILSVGTFYTPERVDPSEFRAELDRTVFGLDEIKRTVEAAIDSAARTKKTGLKILLVGPSGCGKKKICSEIAKVRNKPVVNVPYYSFNSLVDISGSSPMFDHADSGFMGKNITSIRTTDATFVFEAIDETVHQNERNGIPDSCLEKIIGEGLFFDMFLEVEFDMSSSWIFATAESEDKISHKIKSGFDKIIYVRPYENAEKLRIAKFYLIPEILGDFEGKTEFFNNETINYIISDFCYDYGCDMLEKNLRAVFDKAVEEKLDISGGSFSFEEIDAILGKENLMNNKEAIISKHKKEFFNEADIRIIDGMISASHRENDLTGASAIAESQLKYIADFIRNRRFPEKFCFDDFMKKVDRTHDGMKEIKLALARIFNKHSKTHRGSNILIVSKPGQGKTSLLRSAADAYGISCFKIACNGVSDSAVFKGSGPSGRGSVPGRIIGSLSKGGSASMILFDEIDKIGSFGMGYAVVSSLLDCLDEKKYSDYYFDGVTFDLSETIFAATANDISNIPPELLDRFEVIVMPEYTAEQKRSIFLNYTIPAVLDENHADKIAFSDESIEYLIGRSSGSDVRELHTDARKVIETILLQTDEHIITVDDIERCLGRREYKAAIGF